MRVLDLHHWSDSRLEAPAQAGEETARTDNVFGGLHISFPLLH